MAHYAFLDENNIVTEVIVGRNEGEDGIDWEQWYGEFRGQVCKRTSYNANIRGKYAGIGDTYDAVTDTFVAPFVETPATSSVSLNSLTSSDIQAL
jgi:hypothetical protein